MDEVERNAGDIGRPSSKRESAITVAHLALAVSLCAMMLSGFQAYLAFRQNRVVVQPKLDWRIDYDPATENGFYTVAIRVVNVGLGTAIIDLIDLSVDRKSIGAMKEETCAQLTRRLSNLRETSVSIYANHHCASFGSSDRVLYLQKDAEFEVYSLKRNGYAEDAEWADPREHLGVIVHYCSLYNDCEMLR